MGKIYKQNCKECGEYYEGRGKEFCSISCRSKNKTWVKRMADGHTGQTAWNKGKNIQTNDALRIWRINGGTPWNKGLNGVHLSPATEFKVGDCRITGENNINWKGGVSDVNRKIRKSKEYKTWRTNIYQRDGWVCRLCDVKCQTGNIVAHHIDNFADNEDKRFDLDNGVTLCRSCHAKIHNPKNKFTNQASLAFA